MDWGAVRAAYVTGRKSYRQVAAEFDLPFDAVAARGKAEGWPALRKAFQKEAACRAVAGESGNEAQRLGKLIQAADAMSDVLAGVFDDAQQFHRHIVRNRTGGGTSTDEQIFEKVDSRAIRDLTGALKDMTMVLRNLYNLPTQAEAEAQRIAAERLKLEQRRAEAGESADRTVNVVLSDGWGELAQ